MKTKTKIFNIFNRINVKTNKFIRIQSSIIVSVEELDKC